MAEMDIYMRRRLVALGGLVAFFIIFVLLVKSCGGEDEPEPVAPPAETGATGEGGAALTPEEFIQQADAVCGPANLAVSELDPTDPGAIQEEFEITREELESLESLEQAEPTPDVDRFLSDLSAVVTALRAKAKAADPVAQDAAQLEIDTAEVEARESGERAGFADCGQFLDAGETPTGGGRNADPADPAETGAVAPETEAHVDPAPETDTGTVTPPADDTGTVTPPADDTGGGGIAP